MFVLVEPIIPGMIMDYPDLGCAMIMAACKQNGIETSLIKGQTRYLKNIFIDDSDEFYGLLNDLDKERLKEMDIEDYVGMIRSKGPICFKEELRALYKNAFINKSPRNYLNSEAINMLIKHYFVFAKVYNHYIKKERYYGLKIIERYISEITTARPECVGFSIQISIDPLTEYIMKRIKEITSVPVIAGGSFAPFVKDKDIEKDFKKPVFDYLVMNMGEYSAPLLIESIKDRKEPRGIANVFYKKQNEVVRNELKAIDDLDSLPFPDYSQFDLDRYLPPERMLPLQTARGCSWRKCAFCSHHNIYLNSCRTFSPERVVEVLRHLRSEYDCRYFHFHDEEIPPMRAKRVSASILKSGLKDINISIYARLVDEYDDSGLIGSMRKAGISLIQWGLESGSQKILNSMNKGTRVQTMEKILRKSSKNNIVNICFIMFGFPGETRKDARQTINFLKKNSDYIEGISPSFFTLQWHTLMSKNPEKWDIEIKKGGFSYLEKKGLSREKSIDIYNKFMKDFVDLNKTTITSGIMRYLPRGNNSRALYFLIFSHAVLSDLIKNRRLDSIFPIIFGKLEDNKKGTILETVDIRETVFINYYNPYRMKTLSKLEKDVFMLCDGRLSIQEVISVIRKRDRNSGDNKCIHENTIKFFNEVFYRGYGLGFGKRWV